MATRDHRTDIRDEQKGAPGSDAPTPFRRKRQFGMRMAVLAGVIAATGGTTTGLTGAVNTVAAPADTTCCAGGSSSISRTL